MRNLLLWKNENLSVENLWPHTLILNLGGWWIEEDSRPKLRIILIIWRIVTSSTPIISIFSSTAYIIKQLIFGDYENALFSLFVLSTLLQPSIDMYCLFKYERSLKIAMNLLDELTRSTKHPEDMAVIWKKVNRIRKIFLAIFVPAILGLLHWIFRPLFYGVIYGLWTQINHDNWPFIVERRAVFIISYLFETLNGFVIAILFISFNSIFLCIAEYILCHFAVLQNKIERLHLDAKQNETKKLKSIVKSHMKLLEVCKMLRLSTEGVMTLDAIIVVAIYCLVLFSITMEGDIFNTIIEKNVLGVSVSVTVNFVLLCWYSNELSNKCEDFKTTAYMADWLNGSDSQKKTLITLMRRTCLPMKFGGFVEMNLQTIISVLKATFSYYNFLIEAVVKK